MPLAPQNHRKSNFVRHRSTKTSPRKHQRICTTGAAIIAVAAIASCGRVLTLYNKSADPTGPLPVHLQPASAPSYLGVFAKGVPDSYGGR